MSTGSYFGIDASNSKVKENTHNWNNCNQNQWGRLLTASPLMMWLAALKMQKLLVAQAVEME